MRKVNLYETVKQQIDINLYRFYCFFSVDLESEIHLYQKDVVLHVKKKTIKGHNLVEFRREPHGFFVLGKCN